MKKIIYILTVVTVSFIAPSCNKKLDILPQNSATPDQIKTSADVEALLFGAYSALQGYGAYGEQYKLVPDLLAADSQVNWVGTYPEYRDIQLKRTLSTSYVVGTLWSTSYNIINIANTVLDKLSIVDSTDQPTVQGESLFLRATAYFNLVNLFAKPYSDGQASSNLGVPLVLLPTYAYDSTKNKPSRAAVSAIYTQIVTDLTQAVNLLPSTNINARADMYSAKAILSRVYLSIQDYADAATQANDVIQSGNFTLTATYDKAFNNNSNSPEDLFAIQQTVQSNSGTSNQGIITFYAPNLGQPSGFIAGRGDAQIDPGYFTFFEQADFRGNFVTSGTSISGINGYYPNKWDQFYKVIPVARLAEMYLTRGEANLATSGTVGGAAPLDDINLVRARSGASTLSSVAITDFVNERFRELGFEGDRLYTLKRLQLLVDGYDYDNNLLVLPIPQSEIDVNQNLKQNPGY